MFNIDSKFISVNNDDLGSSATIYTSFFLYIFFFSSRYFIYRFSGCESNNDNLNDKDVFTSENFFQRNFSLVLDKVRERYKNESSSNEENLYLESLKTLEDVFSKEILYLQGSRNIKNENYNAFSGRCLLKQFFLMDKIVYEYWCRTLLLSIPVNSDYKFIYTGISKKIYNDEKKKLLSKLNEFFFFTLRFLLLLRTGYVRCVKNSNEKFDFFFDSKNKFYQDDFVSKWRNIFVVQDNSFQQRSFDQLKEKSEFTITIDYILFLVQHVNSKLCKEELKKKDDDNISIGSNDSSSIEQEDEYNFLSSFFFPNLDTENELGLKTLLKSKKINNYFLGEEPYQEKTRIENSGINQNEKDKSLEKSIFFLHLVSEQQKTFNSFFTIFSFVFVIFFLIYLVYFAKYLYKIYFQRKKRFELKKNTLKKENIDELNERYYIYETE